MPQNLSLKDFQSTAVVITAAIALILAAAVVIILLATGIFAIGRSNTLSPDTASSSKSTGSDSSQLSVSNPVQPVAACSSHQAIDSHAWLEIAKDPASHVGECIVIYGEVTQFDSATGTDAFRADVDGTQQSPQYGFVDYPTNTILTGDPQILKDVVEKDLFSADITVLGSESYKTQIGGNTTVPELRVDSIQVTDHLSS